MDDMEVDILLIDHNVHDAELAIRASQKNNLAKRVVHLKDGKAALDFLFGKGKYKGRNTAIKPKVILLDLKMPKVSGLEVLEKLTSNPLSQKIPVVVPTSLKEDSDVQKAYLLRANSYIVRPIDFKKFGKLVNDIGMYWLLLNQSSM